MADKERKQPAIRRVSLSQMIAQAVAKIPGVCGWHLKKRRGKPELYLHLDDDPADDNLTQAATEK